MTDIRSFTGIFDRLAHSKPDTEVFSDYLDICICALSGGVYEDDYLAIVRRYTKAEVELFAKLFAQMTLIMEGDGTGLTDCLGEFYQERLSRGRHGQFFSPQHVCDLMAAIVINKDERNRTVIDPACGSGRMLLSAARINRNNYFFGADIDNTCCKMAAINLVLNGLRGEIAWMNSLSHEHWGGYSITRLRGIVPVIRKLSANEGIIADVKPFGKVDKDGSEANQDGKDTGSYRHKLFITQIKLDFGQ